MRPWFLDFLLQAAANGTGTLIAGVLAANAARAAGLFADLDLRTVNRWTAVLAASTGIVASIVSLVDLGTR